MCQSRKEDERARAKIAMGAFHVCADRWPAWRNPRRDSPRHGTPRDHPEHLLDSFHTRDRPTPNDQPRLDQARPRVQREGEHSERARDVYRYLPLQTRLRVRVQRLKPQRPNLIAQLSRPFKGQLLGGHFHLRLQSFDPLID